MDLAAYVDILWAAAGISTT